MKKFSRRGVLAGTLALGLLLFFQFSFVTPSTRNLESLKPRLSVGATISINGLKVSKVDLEEKSLTLEGSLFPNLIIGDETTPLLGSSSDFADLLSSRLTSSTPAELVVNVNARKPVLSFGLFSYLCCGSDGQIVFGSIQEIESLRLIGEFIDQEAEVLISLSSENCVFNEPRQECSFADFAGQQHRGAVLVDSAFNNSSFKESILDYAIFSESNLAGSSFRGASLKGVLFLRTDLSGVDFTGANLEGAIFSESVVDGAIGIPEGMRTPVSPEVS